MDPTKKDGDNARAPDLNPAVNAQNLDIPGFFRAVFQMGNNMHCQNFNTRL